jgi:flagellar L-ring protein FlgH
MNTATRLTRWLPLAAALALSVGCAGVGSRDDAAFAPTLPIVQSAPPPADGAIYHDSSAMELFGDSRAHRVGDVLTITLNEATQASKKATTTTAKKDNVSVDAPTLYGKVRPAILGNGALASLGSKNSFSGSGDSSQSNTLQGQITVTIAQRLANGNLVIRGEKWLTINQGRELIRIAGIVRPQDISADNTIPSTRVADARITYTGKGALADANKQGWLARFFNSKWMPF